MPRVLVIDDWVPDPRFGSGAPRALAFLRALVGAGAAVTLLPATEGPAEIAGRSVPPGCEVAFGHDGERLGPFLSRHKGGFDLIVVSRPHHMATFRWAMNGSYRSSDAIPVVYDSEALFAARDALQRQVLGADVPGEQAARAIENEVALADGTRIVLAVNTQTAGVFKAAGHPDVRVLGHAVTPRPTPETFDQRDGFLFVGPTYTDDTPNSDSVIWFVENVLPNVRDTLGPKVQLTHAGLQRSARVAARANGHVKSLGLQADLTGAYSAARVFVAPTRFAAGIPYKVHDAAAHGVPIVLTPLLAEQIGWRHEEEVLVAESPDEFAVQCVRLHRDRDLWQHIRTGALERLAGDCDPHRFNEQVAGVLRGALS